MNLIKKNRALMTAAMVACFTVAAPGQAATREDVLEQRIDALARQLEAVQAELKAMKAEKQAAAPATGTSALPTATATVPGQPVIASADVLSRATLSGYGEVNYNHYDHDSSATQATVRRAVFGIGYQFNDSTSLVSEFETENAVVSAGDGGEFAIEQLYVDHRFNDFASTRIGLILIPTGILNTRHEPNTYFGVERNFVETAIIPSTEREGGFTLYGKTPFGLSWDVGLTTSFNLSNWNFNGAGGAESPLGSIHGELANQKAADLAQYVAINYDGLTGLNFGGSVFTGEVGQNQNVGVSASPRFTLWEAHTRYTHGPLQLQALYAHGGFSDTAALNLANAGALTPIPKGFFGYYLQAAYRVWRSGDYALTPFIRYERFNTGSSYAAQPVGFGATRRPTESVLTYGASFFVTPNVVLKADYQALDVDTGSNRFNLGLGFQFY